MCGEKQCQHTEIQKLILRTFFIYYLQNHLNTTCSCGAAGWLLAQNFSSSTTPVEIFNNNFVWSCQFLACLKAQGLKYRWCLWAYSETRKCANSRVIAGIVIKQC